MSNADVMRGLAALQQATLDARRRMADPSLAVSVRQGRYTVQSVVYRPDGTSAVTPLSDPGSLEDAVAFLNNL